MSTSYSSFLAPVMDYPANPNPNPPLPPHQHFHQNILDPFPAEFQLSDYLMLDADILMGLLMIPPRLSIVWSHRSSFKCKKEVKKDKAEVAHRVAFRTKSDLEIMDDGFKWRKYGKKSVKNSPNPRNYYKCSTGGCNVKKRVERDREDSRYVITTYDGVHNHESPCVVYYNQMPLMVPDGWTLQASSFPHHSSSSS
ncbi:hypothetical protein GH714_020030 [Hevea brasiliensis]|uniref:WRKY domain-containing protein n=1 Tax=Hevea brasiliensis TaxID=3981 RepID=A0A6A6K7T3_HEVBR|nr:hypothetical protein GH714_020030 [Hevea brasiliensis]